MSIDYEKLYKNNPKAFQFMEPFLGKYLQVLPINERFKVLDIGCFQGSNLLPFIEFGSQNIYGVDIQRSPLAAFSNKIYTEYGVDTHKSLKLSVGKVEEYEFKIKFDLIMCFKVLQHLKKSDSLKLIERIQNNTTTNGFNLFIIWENGERYDENLGYFTKDEIKFLYEHNFQKWEILECVEKKIDNHNALYFAAKKL